MTVKPVSKGTPKHINPSEADVREARRILGLSPAQQKNHPSALAADHAKLAHINTYGQLPDFYLDRPFTCRKCGRVEIWKAADQKWYYEEAKGHIAAIAVECHRCRKSKRQESVRIARKKS